MGYYMADGEQIDADDPDTSVVICTRCNAHIELIGDYSAQIVDGLLTLDEYDRCQCPRCGATYKEGDALNVAYD